MTSENIKYIYTNTAGKIKVRWRYEYNERFLPDGVRDIDIIENTFYLTDLQISADFLRKKISKEKKIKEHETGKFVTDAAIKDCPLSEKQIEDFIKIKIKQIAVELFAEKNFDDGFSNNLKMIKVGDVVND